MLRSVGLRYLIVGLLTLLMFIPLFFVGQIVDERASLDRQTRTALGAEWGGRQSIIGPILIVPVEATVTVQEARIVNDPETGTPLLDAQGRSITRNVEETRVQSRAPLVILPNQFDAEITTQTDERRRGIFTVPVYFARAEMRFDFSMDGAAGQLRENEAARWGDAELKMYFGSNRALRGEARLSVDDRTLSLEPLSRFDQSFGGITASTGDPRQAQSYELILEFNGAESLMIAPVGRDSRVSFASDWPHPSFTGAFLPDARDVTDAGFNAQWAIPHLARALAQIGREEPDPHARSHFMFGVNFFQPNDLYQQSYRAARYGILFIALTFLTILLMDNRNARPTHPVQYILVGLTQSVFFLLLLAFAEQIGFETAYLAASAATVLLLVGFGAFALRFGKRALVLGLLLSVLYGLVYVILRSTDYALLIGSVIAFFALAGTMFATRNEDWYGRNAEISKRQGWFGSKSAKQAKTVPQPETQTE